MIGYNVVIIQKVTGFNYISFSVIQIKKTILFNNHATSNRTLITSMLLSSGTLLLIWFNLFKVLYFLTIRKYLLTRCFCKMRNTGWSWSLDKFHLLAFIKKEYFRILSTFVIDDLDFSLLFSLPQWWFHHTFLSNHKLFIILIWTMVRCGIEVLVLVASTSAIIECGF